MDDVTDNGPRDGAPAPSADERTAMSDATPVRVYWAEHAQLPDGPAPSVRVAVEGDRITGIQPRTSPRPSDIKLPGVMLPGFANAHSHAFHRALRGRTHGGGGDFWTWRERMYQVVTRLTPERYFDLARAAFGEMVLSGYTAVGEFHYVHHQVTGEPYEDPNAMGQAVIDAAREAGIRLTLLDTLYLTGGLDGDGYRPLVEEQRRFSDGTVDAWARRVATLEEDPMLRVGAAIHSVRAVPRENLGEVATLVRGGLDGRFGHDMPLHIHLSEQPGENAVTAAHHGCTPTELLDAEDVLGPTLTAVHATHLTDHDIELLGAAHAGVCLCPTTERDLADGIGPGMRLARAGASLSIGSDQHAVVDPFEELRGVEANERVTTNERGCFTPRELVDIGSVRGYQTLGWEDGGYLAVGALADFVTVGLDSIRTVGSKPGQVVYSATDRDVDTVVIGGRTVVQDGRHVMGSVALALRTALDQLMED